MLETITLIVAISSAVVNIISLLLMVKIFVTFDKLFDIQAERFENLTKLCVELVSEAISRVAGRKGGGGDERS